MCAWAPPPAFTQTLGYLLAWQVVLQLVEHASDELRPKYSEFIENKVRKSQLVDPDLVKSRSIWCVYLRCGFES